METVGNNHWPLMFDASLDRERTSEKWPLLNPVYLLICIDF